MYIGQKEIDRVEDSMVVFVDGTQKEYTPKQLTYLITEEEKDLSAYMNLVVDSIMPEVQAVIDQGLDELETVTQILNITMEEHNVTQEQLQWIIDRIVSDRIVKHNEFMKATVWDQIKAFEQDMVKYKELCWIISDSHKRAICIAVGKALGTYVEGEPFETFRNEISYSHIKPFI